MPTTKQKQVLRDLSENVGKPLGQAMKEAGYALSTSKTPQRLTQSKAWRDLMERYLPDGELFTAHRGLLNHRDWRARNAALEKAYRLQGRYAPIRIQKEPDPYEEMSYEELRARRVAVEKEIEERRRLVEGSRGSYTRPRVKRA